MGSIISYFGTYKPAADEQIASFKFEYLVYSRFRLTIVIFLGRAIVARSETLRKYAIPGLLFSV